MARFFPNEEHISKVCKGDPSASCPFLIGSERGDSSCEKGTTIGRGIEGHLTEKEQAGCSGVIDFLCQGFLNGKTVLKSGRGEDENDAEDLGRVMKTEISPNNFLIIKIVLPGSDNIFSQELPIGHLFISESNGELKISVCKTGGTILRFIS